MTCSEALTAQVALVLSEDEGLTEHRHALVAQSEQAAAAWSRDTGIPASHRVRVLVLSTALRDWVEALAAPAMVTVMGRDLIGVALAYVDWAALADTYLQEDVP